MGWWRHGSRGDVDYVGWVGGSLEDLYLSKRHVGILGGVVF